MTSTKQTPQSPRVGDLTIYELRRALMDHGIKLWELSLAGPDFSAQLEKDRHRRSFGGPLSMPAGDFVTGARAQFDTRGSN